MVKVGLAIAGAAGTATTAYLGYSLIHKSSKPTIGEKWSEFLLLNGTEAQWSLRKTKLSKGIDESLTPELRKLKSNTDGLKDWCAEAAKKTYSDVDSLYLSNVRSYCTFYVRDKFEGKYIESGGSWEGANKRLTDLNSDDGLSSEMKGIKEALKKVSSPPKTPEDLKNWCTSAYDKPYLGENDSLFKDVTLYCSKVGTTPSPQ
ncbi:hypothetical protein MHC_01425 [Mycoplasma haemocanis str. Illinois]|uniref:Uncharacterized protein n=1 Tax=Mycoplasma haemocanis (strain Illinois) TaxID=1111676 RepID=H6N679_MYCHN|nr:hypothetical protein [Mycoplasma haemocanis]AEW45151.1 hypothetical protein MHC_01425 [Mycoplasma haemocanis str. Illinois]